MSMRRFILLLGAILALLSVTAIAAQQEEPTTSPTIPLEIIDSDPLSGEELELNSSITLYFDRPVNCDTAQQALSLEPVVAGTVTCNEADSSVTFTPEGEYERGAAYKLTVSDAIRAQDGGTLEEAFELEFNSVGFLGISQVLPADNAQGVEADSAVTVIFNRPVVPLVTVEDMADLPNPLTFEPAVEGTGEWINTSIYMFRPDPAFAGGTEYTVTVDAGLQAVDGAVLQEEYNWSFTTLLPEIVEVYPEDMTTDILLDQTFRITFNQPMNRQSVEDNFYLRPDGETEGTAEGDFTWSEDGMTVSFKPGELLQIDTVYEIGLVSENVKAEVGGTGLIGRDRWSVVTVPYPSILSTDPYDGQQDAYPYGGFTIYFASPMKESTLRDKVTIEPEPWRDFDSYYRDYDNSYTLSFPTEPSTDYTVTIAPGMEDRYGNEITTELVVRYRTAPYDPSIVLQVPGTFGFYNANRPETQLFVIHRNVSQLDLQLYSVPVDEFVTQAGDNYYGMEDYSPSSDELLRAWQVPANAPQDRQRYELLTLGGGAQESATCPGAPASRLQVGDTAVVITDPDPVRARANPGPDGEILTQLYQDYRLPVVGGPECLDGFIWWEVELRDGSKAWVAEGDQSEYYIDLLVPSATTEVTVTPGENSGQLAPGAYFLQVTSPETSRMGYQPSRHMLLVATANLVVKASTDNVLVWATNVETGEPIPGAPISVYTDTDPSELYAPETTTGTTDENGLAVIPTSRVADLYTSRVAVLQTEEHFGIGALDWSNGIEPYQFGQDYDFYPSRYRLYMYTDRPIYRPGQPVYFRGVVRLRDDVTYTPAGMSSVPVQIVDDRGEIVFEERVDLTPFGTFSGQFDIAPDATLGYYRIDVSLPSEFEYYSEGGGVSFGVAEYRLPEFQVEVTPDQDQVSQGDTINVIVDSRYYFGGAVSNANVNYSVVSNPYNFNYTGPGYYSFYDFDYDSGPGEFYGYYGQEVASGTVTADAEGKAMIEIPAELEDATQSQVFTIEAVVTDESDQAVAGRVDVIVHKGLVYVGVRPQNYVNRMGQEAKIDLIAVDWESNPIANQAVEIEVVERRWSSVQEEDEFGRTTWNYEVEEISVTEGDVVTDDQGKATYTFTPPSGGVFKVRVKARDEAGNEIVSSTTLWVSSSEYVSWRQQNSNRIDLIADQEDYSVGDTAQILITSPFQGRTEALVTVERGDVLSYEHITLDSNSYVYEIPIREDFAPNVYVSAIILKGVDETNPVAAFRMGMVQLGVDNERKEISIDITPDREQAGPREDVTYTIRTTDYKGDPLQAEVGVGLTDLASLSIADPNSGPILAYFYGQQGLSVRTATPLTINTDQITQTTLDTIKGGGGGGGEGGIFDIREDFVDTAFWNGAVTTDENGVATITVTMPDNLTTWRLDARAVTSGSDGLTLVGQDTFDLLSTKPLLIRPVTPRFFVVGDQVALVAIVNNNTGETMDVVVSVEGTGVTFEGEREQTFNIPSGQRQRIEWPVTVDDVNNIDLTFFANGNDGAFTDASKPPLGQGDDRLLPVYKYEVPETVGTGGTLREGGSRTEAIALPQRFDVTQGELTVELEPSLAATTIDGLEYLRNYPHQCIEQTVSRFLPNIMTYRALDSLDVANEDLERQLNTGVNFALQRLYAQQKPDGGWGWFVQDDSNPLTTAYALIGLAEARDYGFTVDEGVISRAQDFLRTTFVVPALNQPTWRLNRQAFILYALARSGDPDVARTVTLYDDGRARLSYYAKGFLAMTLNLIDPTDTSRTDVLLSDLVNGAVISATGAHWEEAERDYWNWNTDTRSTAIVLDALIKLSPDSELIPNVVRWLMVARTAEAWETTQETAWAVMALTDWMVLTGELRPAYDFSASLNGETLTENKASPENVRDSVELRVQVSELLADEANRLVISRTDGDGVLYYTAHLEAYLPVPEVEPLDRGIIVERRYTILGDEGQTPVTEARVGDVVQVRLTVIAPNDLHYVVIEDPIPAGSDAVNPQLTTSQQIGTQPGLDAQDPLSYGWGWWYFSNIEFRDEKVVLYSTYLPRGTYEYVYTIRAGLPGVFNVIPATGQEFYFPEVYGRSAGSTFTILPAE
jgi:alpha-2-macroglobulin